MQLRQPLRNLDGDRNRFAQPKTSLSFPFDEVFEVSPIGELRDQRHVSLITMQVANAQDVLTVAVLKATVDVGLPLKRIIVTRPDASTFHKYDLAVRSAGAVALRHPTASDLGNELVVADPS